jgi:predicted anti-sigma-YlaC factor YlaD
MKCENVSQELIAYLDGRMSAAERRETEEHLAGCAACRARAEEFRRMWSVMAEVPLIEPSAGFDARVRQRVAAEPQRRWFAWFAPQARLAFSAVLLIALTVWVAKRPTRNSGTLHIATAASSEQDFNAIKDLGVLENYDVVTKMDALSELVPSADQPPPEPRAEPTESND